MKNNTILFMSFVASCVVFVFFNTLFYVLGEHTGNWLLGALGCNAVGIFLWEAAGKVLEK